MEFLSFTSTACEIENMAGRTARFPWSERRPKRREVDLVLHFSIQRAAFYPAKNFTSNFSILLNNFEGPEHIKTERRRNATQFPVGRGSQRVSRHLKPKICGYSAQVRAHFILTRYYVSHIHGICFACLSGTKHLIKHLQTENTFKRWFSNPPSHSKPAN